MRIVFASCLALAAVLCIAVVEPAAAAVVDVGHAVSVQLAHLSPGDLADLGSAFEPTLAGLALGPIAGMPRHFGPRFDAPDDGGTAVPTALTRDEILAIARDEIKRAGGTGDGANVDALAARLADEKEKTATARRELAASRAETAAFKTRLPDGAVVLTGDEATQYTALKGRDGYDAAPLAKAVADLNAGSAALGKLQTIDAQAGEDAAIRAAGYEPATFRKYLTGVKPRLEGEGDAAKAVVTVTVDGKEVTKPLAEVVAADYAEALPILTGNAATQARRGGEAVPQRPASSSAKDTPATTADITADKRRSGQYAM